MKKFVLIVFVLIITGSQDVANGITRQESTRQLKKVVYYGKCSEEPQETVSYDPGGGTMVTYHYAKISIPEIALDNMPLVKAYGFSQAVNVPSGIWVELPSILRDGEFFIWWKYDNGHGGIGIYAEDFKIVVIYESTLEVENIGTGSSLKLNWSGAPEGKRIEGYTIKRREATTTNDD